MSPLRRHATRARTPVGTLAGRLCICAIVASGCSSSSDSASDTGVTNDVADGDDRGSDADADGTSADDDGSVDADRAPLEFTAVTFNTGSGPVPPAEDNGGYGPDQKAVSDEWYGNGLAWKDVVADTRAFFERVDADVVVFQEIFWPGECDAIPGEARTGFVCEDELAEDATVAAMVLGDGWQIACHPGNPDKCAAVRRAFGRFRGCDGDLCIEGLRGSRIDGCGGGARVAAATIDLADGSGTLNLVNVHGTSGFEADDVDCRVRQVERVFLGDGDESPLVTDGPNLLMGDLNTDPGRLAGSDASAARWIDFVGEGLPFYFLTDVGQDAEPTYVLLNIDHVVSNALEGNCAHAGVGDGGDPVTDVVYFDHAPAVCRLSLAR